jgi:hypothetical protein
MFAKIETLFLSLLFPMLLIFCALFIFDKVQTELFSSECIFEQNFTFENKNKTPKRQVLNE